MTSTCCPIRHSQPTINNSCSITQMSGPEESAHSSQKGWKPAPPNPEGWLQGSKHAGTMQFIVPAAPTAALLLLYHLAVASASKWS